MRSSTANPALVLAGTLSGFVLAVALLFASMGGGFLLAVAVLALTPAAAGVMALAGALERRAAAQQSAAFLVQPLVAQKMALVEGGSTLTDGENPLVLVGALLGGCVLAGLALLLVNGGGFLLAVAVLALMPAAAGAMALAGAWERRATATQSAAPMVRPLVAQKMAAVQGGSTLTDGENPLVLVGALLGGCVLAGLALLLVNGGGFLLAVLTLILTPAVVGGMSLAAFVERRTAGQEKVAPTLPAQLPHTARLSRRPATLGLAAAATLATFVLGTMYALHGSAHVLDDLKQDALAYVVILAGFAVFVALFTSIRQRTPAIWVNGGFVTVGVALGTLTLMACCVTTLAALFQAPVLTTLAVALLVYKVPLLAAGIAVNGLGLLPLARAAAGPQRV